MKDYTAAINKANMAPNKARNEYQGSKPPRPFWSAGGDYSTDTMKPGMPGVPVAALSRMGTGNRTGVPPWLR